MNTAIKTKNTPKREQTLFTIETDYGSTWYIDTDGAKYYDVHKDENFKVRRKSLGKALEYIFKHTGIFHLKLTKA